MWKVVSVDKTIGKKLKKYKSNKSLISNYIKFIEDLQTAKDPRTLGEPKQGKFRQCYGKHMTKSHGLIYYVDFQQNTVFLIDLDDHKNLYGRDNRIMTCIMLVHIVSVSEKLIRPARESLIHATGIACCVANLV